MTAEMHNDLEGIRCKVIALPLLIRGLKYFDDNFNQAGTVYTPFEKQQNQTQRMLARIP